MPLEIDKLTLFGLTPDRKPATTWGDMEAGEKRDIYEGVAGIGLVTGERSGLFVLDWDDTSKEPPGPMPDTYTRKTRRGFHFYFKHPGYHVPTLVGFPCEGWDIRGDGGMVVFVHDGYEEIDGRDPAECPQWLSEKIAEYELRRLERKSEPVDYLDVSSELGAKMFRAAARDAAALDVGLAGERDACLFRAALQLVRGRRMSPDIAEQLLLQNYCPRVSIDGKETVSPTRVKYKCLQAALQGTYEFCPFDADDIERWYQASEAVRKEEMRNEKDLLPVEEVAAISDEDPEPVPDYRPLLSHEMVPGTKMDKTNFMWLSHLLATHDSWVRRLKFDLFAQEYVCIQPPVHVECKGFFSQDDVSAVRMWLACACNIDAGHENVERALTRVAKDHSFHPVMNYFRRIYLQQDVDSVAHARQILEDYAVTGLGVSEAQVVNYVTKFMIGAVRRILEPGCKHDGVLVLQGPQNTGKSSLLYALSPVREWVQESLPDLENKDACEALRGRWLVEIAELQALLRKAETVAKDFLSRQEDSYRRPYDKGPTRHPRECVFIATTNDDEILRDSTGSRRYWIVRTEGIDLDYVTRNRDLIWAAALKLALEGEANQLTLKEIKDMEVIQEPFRVTDPWEDDITEYLSDKSYVKSVQDVFAEAVHHAPNIGDVKKNVIRDMTRQDQLRVADVMRKLGWEKKRPSGKKGWYKS